MRKKLLIGLLVACLSVGAASAQFGSGIVYDPTNYHNAVLRYLQTGDAQMYAAVMALAASGGLVWAIFKVLP